MTELQLFRFIKGNDIEYSWSENNGKEDVLIFPDFYDLRELCSLLTYSAFEDGIDCKLKGGYVAIWMRDICDLYDINLEIVFEKDKL